MERVREFIRRTLFVGLLVAVVAVSAGAKPIKKKPVTASSASKRSKGKVSETPARHHQGSSSGTSRSQARKVVVTRKKVNGRWVRTTQVTRVERGPVVQPHPEPERYQQIQQALAANGYYKGEVNGQWNEDSVQALKQFQTDRKIPNDGKISSLSLIGLGLGPNRQTASGTTPPAGPATP